MSTALPGICDRCGDPIPVGDKAVFCYGRQYHSHCFDWTPWKGALPLTEDRVREIAREEIKAFAQLVQDVLKHISSEETP